MCFHFLRPGRILKTLAKLPEQAEFDFFMSNVSTGHQYHDAIRERLMAEPLTPAERAAARSVLMEIVRWLGWQTYECQKNASELSALLGVPTSEMAQSLKILERVGAITRLKRGQMKVITLTPDGVYRGDIDKHAEAVDRYRAEVVPFPNGARTEPPEVA